MSGIVFMNTVELAEITRFYCRELGFGIWIDQGDCQILRHGNLLLGFCQRRVSDTEGMVTLFYPSRGLVDAMYDRLHNRADAPPQYNEKYGIYQFFARDPEGRALEFQYFESRVSGYEDGAGVLTGRRSVRRFQPGPIPQEQLDRLWELCRYAPTSRNTQGYYFKVVTDPDLLEWLAGTRGGASAPIGRAPCAVAVCADPEMTIRPDQDGCIAAYHLMLAAAWLGLGTCWIAALNRDDVKAKLTIPADHYLATVTPLGLPAEDPDCPPRHPAERFIRS